MGTGPVGRITVPDNVNPYFPAEFANEHCAASADGTALERSKANKMDRKLA
jgi:hypothetical protein